MAPSTTARCMRPLVPFFKPGSTECNSELRADTASAQTASNSARAAPTTVQVRNWDHATGVFKNPVAVVVKDALTAAPATAAAAATVSETAASGARCRVRANSEERTRPASARLLTPAAIRARRNAQEQQSKEYTHNQEEAREQDAEPQVSSQPKQQPQVRPRPRASASAAAPASAGKTQRKPKPARSPRAQSPPQERTTGAAASANICTTPVRKPHKRRALSLSPALPPSQPLHCPSRQNWASIDIPSSNTASASVIAEMELNSKMHPCTKFAGSTFDAASPAATSFPIPRLYAKNYNGDVPPDDGPRRMLLI